MSKSKTIWTLIAACSLTMFAVGAHAEPPAWAKQEKTDMTKEAKPGTGPGMEGGESHAKPKGKAYGVYGTQPSKTKGEETESMMENGKGKAKSKNKEKKMEEEANSMMENGKSKAKKKEKKMK